MTADIPTEVLHQLYRDYCLSKHVYGKPAYADEAARQAHIDYDARSYYEEAHMGPLAELVKSAFAAGRESLGQLTEERAQVQYHTTLWFDDGDSDGYMSYGPGQGTPEFEQGVVFDAEKQLGPWDGTCSVVRVETRSYREVTYRTDEKVLGRFGDWSEVTDA